MDPATRHTRRLLVLGVTVLVAVGSIAAAVWAAQPAPAPAQHHPRSPAHERGCVVTAQLVNPCRPWLGATANDYPGAPDNNTRAQIHAHEQRIGRQVDIVHTYHAAGSDSLSADDVYFAKRPDTILFTNWKPTAHWRNGDGSKESVTRGIDRMAASVRALGDHKIMMTIAHEPENDLTTDPNCPNVGYTGHAGTPAQYIAMWRFVEQRFAADGVHNVVWVMDYNNIAKWDCVVPDVWPGNDLVDWVMFDAYAGDSPDFVDNVQTFENLLMHDTDATHAFTSKPWGIAEWGMSYNDAFAQRSYIDQAHSALDDNLLPRIKAYIAYDSNNGRGSLAGQHENLRIGYDDNGRADPAKQRAYDAFANDPLITGSFALPG